ncbi:MAG: DNA (cytosine-5-)-methyltransferase [Spirobacillus cienkowskii]|uniref:DNA (Cytosine-5-)-methyltransferase n=1 Tax=Spirobacillus cienkowskii TaxID=495820 RepID=A0A369KZP0_9BACT|nr:MAG: DNA (cytosine-5-)-methyltransferase [Spirobacillus cienkowskii]
MVSIFSNNDNTISAELFADIISVSKSTISKWEKNEKIKPVKNPITGRKEYSISNLSELDEFKIFKEMAYSNWDKELKIKPLRPYQSIELFAGAGGLAIGLEKAGFTTIAVNEVDKDSCKTLRFNRPSWNVIEGDIKNVDFTKFNNIDFVSGGFPCQAFSYAGNKLGFEDARGTLFFEQNKAAFLLL